jgi:hypothetical protein
LWFQLSDSLLSLFSVVVAMLVSYVGARKLPDRGMDMGGGGRDGTTNPSGGRCWFDAAAKAVGIVICRLATAWCFLWSTFSDPAAQRETKILWDNFQRQLIYW